MILFDAHTHIDMKQFQGDLESVVQRAHDAGLLGMVSSSMGPESFQRTLGIMKRHDGFIYHSAGCSVSQLTEEDATKTIELAKRHLKEIVAIGEVGLDYYWIKDNRAREAQEPLFSHFIELAQELNLPIVIHSRKAEERVAEMLERQFSGDVLMHCFDGSPQVARRIADAGWSITLPANFDRYRNRIAAAKMVPLEQILLETDGPYLSPTPNRNEPANVQYGCKALSSALGISVDEVSVTTTNNAKRFYRL